MQTDIYLPWDSVNEELYAGGAFTSIGGVTTGNIAMWDGTNWNALGSTDRLWVDTLVWDNSRGELYVGGSFSENGGAIGNHIAQWDGANWSSFGSGTDNRVLALLIDSSSDTLFVGGRFTTAGNNPSPYISQINLSPTVIETDSDNDGVIDANDAFPQDDTKYNTTSFFTELYGTTIPDVDVTGQGRISGMSEWGLDASAHLVIKSFMADGKTASGPFGSNAIEITCTPFTLVTDDYITGYTISQLNSDSSIVALRLNTRQGNQYSCGSLFAEDREGVTVDYGPDATSDYHVFDYLVGWTISSSAAIDGIKFEFLPLDTDDDGVPNSTDTDDDNDGVLDTEDAFQVDAAASVDTDGDGNPDDWLDSCDATCQANSGLVLDDDDDDDGLSDEAEVNIHSTDPLEADTDNDGMTDGYEIDNGLDPLEDTGCPQWMCGSSKIWMYKLLQSNP